MPPVACVATYGRPNVSQHASLTCQEIPPGIHGSQHGRSECIATHRPLGVGSHKLRWLGDRHHVLAPSIKPPRAFRSICAISALLVNFRPAINPKYFSAPFPMS
ncbi:hypothetical protein Bca101_059132 [Brassica carinata]